MTAQDVIKNFMSVLSKTNSSGRSAINEAVQACSSFSSAQDAVDQMISDCESNPDSFLLNYCGIILDNDDTGAITGSDASGDSIKSAETVVDESGALTAYTGNSFTVNGLTFQLTTLTNGGYSNHYTDLNYSDLTDTQKFMWNCLYTWWAKNSLDLIISSYGDAYDFSDSSCNIIHVGFVDDDSSTLAAVVNWSDGETVVDLDLKINLKYYSNIDTSDYNGLSSDTNYYLDRTLAHELTHAAMAVNMNYFNNLPVCIREGLAELTHGIDDTRRNRIETIAGSADSLSSALDLDSTYTTTANPYAAGYMFLRWFAKQVSNSFTVYDNSAYFNNVTISGLTDNATGNDFSATNSAVTINSSIISAGGATVNGAGYTYKLNGAGTLYNGGSNVKLKGSSAGDSLTGNSSADKIFGYGGADTIIGGDGADSLSGGAGNDIISGGNGNDSLIGGDGADSLSGGAGNDIISGGNDNDTIIGGDGADSLSGGAGDDIISGGNDNDTINGGSGADSLTGGAGNDWMRGHAGDDTIFGGDGADTIYGYGGADYISGGADNDYLIGGTGEDTIFGGAGNDTMRGGAGNDVFVYKKSTGNDVITDYSSSDKITINAKYTSSISGENVILTCGTGTLTILNGVNKNITINDITTKFSENIADNLTSFIAENKICENITAQGGAVYVSNK